MLCLVYAIVMDILIRYNSINRNLVQTERKLDIGLMLFMHMIYRIGERYGN